MLANSQIIVKHLRLLSPRIIGKENKRRTNKMLDIFLKSISVISRQHLQIKNEYGRCFAEDCGSSNGTRINGVEIRGRGWQELKNRDGIDFAGVATATFKA